MNRLTSTDERCPLCLRFLFDVGRARLTCKPRRDDEDCFEAGYHYWRTRAECLQQQVSALLDLRRTPADAGEKGRDAVKSNTRPYRGIWEVYCTVPFTGAETESLWETESLAMQRRAQLGEGRYGVKEIKVYTEMNEYTRWYLGDDE